MRKRWTFSPGPFIVLWGVVGLIALFVVAGLTDGCETDGNRNLCGINGPPSKWVLIEACIWLGPFVLAALGYCLVKVLPAIAMTLWQARPRRIEEPVTDDLREIEPPGEQGRSPSSGA